MSQPVIDSMMYARICDIVWRACAGQPLPGEDGHDGILHTGTDPRRAALAIAEVLGARVADDAPEEDDEDEIPPYVDPDDCHVGSVMFLSWPGSPSEVDVQGNTRAIVAALIRQMKGPISVRLPDGRRVPFVTTPVFGGTERDAARRQVLVNMGLL